MSVGSAADLPTENFYMKNGFRPTHMMATVRYANLPENYKELGYDFSAETRSGGEVRLVVECRERDKAAQARMREDLGAREVIFIMEKEIEELCGPQSCC